MIRKSYFRLAYSYPTTSVCPVFPSSAKRLHHNFPDPAKATGSPAEVRQQFRAVRDQVKAYAHDFVRVANLAAAD